MSSRPKAELMLIVTVNSCSPVASPRFTFDGADTTNNGLVGLTDVAVIALCPHTLAASKMQTITTSTRSSGLLNDGIAPRRTMMTEGHKGRSGKRLGRDQCWVSRERMVDGCSWSTAPIATGCKVAGELRLHPSGSKLRRVVERVGILEVDSHGGACGVRRPPQAAAKIRSDCHFCAQWPVADSALIRRPPPAVGKVGSGH